MKFHDVRQVGAAAAFLLAMVTAGADEPVVGTRTLELLDQTRQRPVVTELWFEAAPGTARGSFTALPPLEAMPLVTDASPALGGDRTPLIVISHGNWATRYAYAWLAIAFVKAGYLVLSPSHPGTMFGDLRPELRVRLRERSLDVTFALDQHPRIKAFYLMASGVAAGFDEGSLQAIDKPMLFDTARGDPVLDPGIGSTLLARRIPGARETVRDVGHFSYAPQCKPLIGRLLAGQVCEDPPGVDRADVHARVKADALRFFKGTL